MNQINDPEEYLTGYAEGYEAGYDDGKADMEWYLHENLYDCDWE